MPGSKQRSHADIFKDIEDSVPKEVDPEDDVSISDDSEVTGSYDNSGDYFNGREHYEPVGRSKLRKTNTSSLGPQYAGARVSREMALLQEQDHDPFTSDISKNDSSFESAKYAAGSVEATANSESGDSSSSDGFEQSDGEQDNYDNESISSIEVEGGDVKLTTGAPHLDRAELRRLMNVSQKSAISQANKSDADKGHAVKRQRASFDSLLNTRIRLQGGLVAANSFPKVDTPTERAADALTALETAEIAALKLWGTINDLRSVIETSRGNNKRKRFEATSYRSSAKIWAHMQTVESATLPNLHKTLDKWSAKAQAATAVSTSKRLNNAARNNSITDVIREQLSNTERLVSRTRVPRSCAPLQANAAEVESADIFDDADFYGVLLKELLEQRNADSASLYQVDVAAQQWRAARDAKTRKQVDTKASKGRKMRHLVHERLQNFMAPEDRGTWGERQVDELFGSLLGKQMVLEEEGDASERVEDGDDQTLPTVRLFR